MMPSREWNRLSAAERALVEEHQQEVPVALAPLARALGAPVLSATLAPGISGELRRNGDHFEIRVNRHEVRKRQRFTVAHELAHFLLHRDAIGEGIEDDVLYRTGLPGPREAEANRLASDILLPEMKLRQAYSNLLRSGEQDIISRLSDEFGASETAIKIKLGLS